MCVDGHSEHLHVVDPRCYSVALSIVRVTEERIVIGIARCRKFSFPPISTRELATELSAVDAANKINLWMSGKHKPSGIDEVNAWRKRAERWLTRSAS